MIQYIVVHIFDLLYRIHCMHQYLKIQGHVYMKQQYNQYAILICKKSGATQWESGLILARKDNSRNGNARIWRDLGISNSSGIGSPAALVIRSVKHGEWHWSVEFQLSDSERSEFRFV